VLLGVQLVSFCNKSSVAFYFLDSRVRELANGGWSLHIYSNLTLPSPWDVAIYCAKKKY
jgi:hypothetical protein